MILNVQERMYIIEELTDWITHRWDSDLHTSWTEHSTLSTCVLNEIVRDISKDHYIDKPNLRRKYWRLLKTEKPDLFIKIKLFVEKE